MRGGTTRGSVVVMALAILLPAVASCGAAAGGPPEIVVDRTACSHCGMLISEPLYAAAYQAAGSEGRTFDDIGCLLAALATESATALRHELQQPRVPPSGGRVWFHDVASGEWIDGRAASFVRSSTIRTPMGGGIIAFRDPAVAARAADVQRGVLVTSIAALIGHQGDGQ